LVTFLCRKVGIALNSTLGLPSPHSLPQRIDPVVGGGLSAKGLEFPTVPIAGSSPAHAGEDVAAFDDQVGVRERLRRGPFDESIGMGVGFVPRLPLQRRLDGCRRDRGRNFATLWSCKVMPLPGTRSAPRL
jgi:hypothetical protein